MGTELEQQTGGEGGGEEIGGGYDDATQFAPEVVEEAREGGWKPKHEMRDPSKYVDPETFVKRGREILPIVNKNNERLKREIAELKASLDKSNMSVKQLQEYHSKLEERAYDRAMKDLKAQKRGAIEAGDFAAAADIEDELDELKTRKPEPAAQEPTPQQQDTAFFNEWRGENRSWFNDDNPDLVDHANAVALRIRRQSPELIGRPFLDEITKAVKKAFPEKFGSPRKAPSAVEGGNAGGASSRNGEVKIADLPPEARAAYRELAREDWYKDLAKSQKLTTEQLYIQDYGV